MSDEQKEHVLQTAEAWADAKCIPAWLLAAARAHAQWPMGLQLDEVSFNEAVKAVEAVSLR